MQVQVQVQVQVQGDSITLDLPGHDTDHIKVPGELCQALPITHLTGENNFFFFSI